MTMTKSELRVARKQAVSEGRPLVGELAVHPDRTVPRKDRGGFVHKTMERGRKAVRAHVASRSEQHATYLDCGPGAWDDR